MPQPLIEREHALVALRARACAQAMPGWEAMRSKSIPGTFAASSTLPSIYASTGHIRLATLLASNADQALERIIHFFPADRHNQIWIDLSLNESAIVAHQLQPTVDGRGRRAAVEMMLNPPLVADQIREGEVHLIKVVMHRSGEQGMQTFDDALYKLHAAGEISYSIALSHADAPNDLRLMIKLGADSDPSLMNTALKLTLQEAQTAPLRRLR